MLEKYHDLKWNLRQFGSFKILSLSEGCSFQTRKTELTCESWREFLAGLQLQDVTCVLEKEQEGRLRHHQLHTHSCNPTEQLPPRSWARETLRCTSWTKRSPAQVNGLAGSQTWPDSLGQISEPGSWRAQGSRPAASQAHLHSPGSPSWALGLLPPPTHPQGHPFPEPLEAATPHITSLPPGLHHLWALSLPPTPGHVLMGNLPSGVDGWLGDRALSFLWTQTYIPHPCIGLGVVSMVTGLDGHYSVYLFTYC